MADIMYFRFEWPVYFRKRVFIVHGRDMRTTQAVASFQATLDLDPIILQEQPNEGRTWIEKFENHAKADLAIILITPDDIGYPKDQPADITARARQNVIFELGFFIGKLGRKRVCSLQSPGVVLPSDLHGIACVLIDNDETWKKKLVMELKKRRIRINIEKGFLEGGRAV